MNYKTVKLPAEFLEEVKQSATEEFRSVSQQLLYCNHLGQESCPVLF